MNAPLPQTATHADINAIAAALCITRQAAAKRSNKEYWAFDEVTAPGNPKRLYPIETLPKEIQIRLKIARAVTHPDPFSAALRNVVEVMDQLDRDAAAAEKSRLERGEANLKALTGLTDREAFSLKAHTEIVEGWKVWFHRAQPLSRSKSWEPFANAYNLAEIPVSRAVREAYPEIAGRSVQRWVLNHEKGNFDALIDRRNGSKLKKTGVFDLNVLLAQTAVKIMMDKPGIKTGQLERLLKTASVCRETGEVLFDPPSIHQVYRFQKSWIEENAEVYLKATNPDAWKNKYMLAMGQSDEDVTELNGRWEMDATPADWLLLDEDGIKRRYTVSVIIDVWSRRIMVVVSRTPKTQTHCFALRLALLAWGVPKQIVTDQGADYKSDHFRTVLDGLDIDHRICDAFSPEQKGIVERVIGTLNHSILELLPNFAGHNVADRKAIEARQSFADRLMKKGAVVDFSEAAEPIDGAKMQALINQWITGIYEHRVHSTLETSPYAKAASWAGEVRRITDERALDILLARPSEGGTRTLQKKGIKIDGAWFIAPELGRAEMGSALEIYETEDLGKVVVYYRKNFLCVAENPARTGIDRATIAVQGKAEQKKRIAESFARHKKDTKGKPSTDALVRQGLNDAAAAAGKLVSGEFGATPYVSAGLMEAAKAKVALEGQPVVNPEHDKLIEQARQSFLEQCAPKAPVVQLPPASRTPTPLESMNDTKKHELWLEFDATLKGGGELTEGWQQRFHAGWTKTSAYRAQLNLRAQG